MVSLTDSEFETLVGYVKKHFGINLINKRTLIEGRLGYILLNRQFKSYAQYFQQVISDNTGSELSFLIDRLTTNHTYFMREEQHFKYLEEKVFPYLVSNADGKEWRIWSAGCSSGEEPYTIAMIISSYFGERKVKWDTRILATDISTKVLDSAIKGVYEREQVEPLPILWKNNYLQKLCEERFEITEKIKKEVIFKKLNLMDGAFPFKKKFHVIFCRNVMIYFDAETKKKLMEKFYELTEPGGYLFIGLSETLDRENVGYRYIMPSVYRKG